VTPERERDLERICQAALERPVAERAGFLAEACGGAADLRQAVEQLLAKKETAASFLETPALVVAAQKTRASLADGHSTTAGATTTSTRLPRGDRLEPSDRLWRGRGATLVPTPTGSKVLRTDGRWG
jgi:hypothetical protein